jgi:hypothetical protein
MNYLYKTYQAARNECSIAYPIIFKGEERWTDQSNVQNRIAHEQAVFNFWKFDESNPEHSRRTFELCVTAIGWAFAHYNGDDKAYFASGARVPVVMTVFLDYAEARAYFNSEVARYSNDSRWKLISRTSL